MTKYPEASNAKDRKRVQQALKHQQCSLTCIWGG